MAGIDAIGRFEDPIAVEIERVKQPRLIARGLRFYVAQRVCLDKKRNLEDFVIRPESHAMLSGIIASALVRKAE